MALSPHNDPIRSSNQVPSVIIDNGNCELYLLSTLEHSGLLYFPYGAATRSAIAAPHLELGSSVDHGTGNHIGNHS
jgi:hypothetical protein